MNSFFSELVNRPSYGGTKTDSVSSSIFLGVSRLTGERYLGQSNLTKDSVRTCARSIPFTDVPQQELWRPMSLSRTILSAFLAVFCLCLAIFCLLHATSSSEHGFVAVTESSSTQQYIWTYLPTAVFSLIAAAWEQVDYRAKQMMPWVAMQRGAQPARKSLLLDYLTPLNVVTLLKSVIARHWLTATAVIGTLSLQILLVLSTGLFSSRYTYSTHKLPGSTLLTNFDAESYKHASNMSGSAAIANDAKPWDLYFGVKEYDLAYPNGTTDVYVYKQFNHTFVTNVTVSAEVDVFSADLACESGHVANISELSGNDYLWSVSSQTCSSLRFFSRGTTGNDDGSMVYAVTDNCKNLPYSDEGMRVAFLAGQFGSFSEEDPTTSDYDAYTVLVCKPSYQVQKASVSFNATTSLQSLPDISLVQSSAPRMLQNLSYWDVASPLPTTFCNRLGSSGASLEYCAKGFSSVLSNASHTLSFTDVLNASYPQTSASAFQDSTILSQAAIGFFRSWTAQMAGLYLAVPTEKSLTVKVTVLEARLYTSDIALWLSVSALAILLLACLSLIWKSHHAAMSRDPSSIGGLATILACDNHAHDACLRNPGMIDEKSLHKVLVEHHFSLKLNTGSHSGAMITAEDLNHGKPYTLQRSITDLSIWSIEESRRANFYAPYIVTKPAMVAVLVIPICLVLALEILHRQSQAHNGLSDVQDDQYFTYAWRYVPAIVMTGMKLLYGSLDSVVKWFQPFHTFHKGEASPRVGLMDNYFIQTAPQILWTAGKKRQWAIFAMATSSLASPFLTIIVSGLFTTKDVEYDPYTVQVRRLDNFNSSMSDPDSADWTPSADVSIDDADMSYPGGTYNGLILPQLDTNISNWDGGGKSRVLSASSIRISATVPVLRANANCTAFDTNKILEFSYNEKRYSPNTGGPEITTDVPKVVFAATPPRGHCNATLPLELNSSSAMQWPYNSDVRFEMNMEDRETQWGYWYDVGDSYYDSYYNRTYQETYPDCPRIITYLATMDSANQITGTSFYCSPYIEQLSANLTLLLPSLTIDYDNPPIADESTGTPFSSLTLSGIEGHLSPIGPGNQSTYAQGSFYNTLLYGRNPHKISDLLLGSSTATADLNAAINTLYAEIAASYLNTQRLTLPTTTTTSDAEKVNLTIQHASRERVLQNTTPTRILQVLLTLLTLCGVTAYMQMEMRRLLPVNPNSIGGVISLLVGAEMLERDVIPEGAEWLSDEELKKTGVFEDCSFRLGWWGGGEVDLDGDGDEDGGKGRFGIDVVREREWS